MWHLLRLCVCVCVCTVHIVLEYCSKNMQTLTTFDYEICRRSLFDFDRRDGRALFVLFECIESTSHAFFRIHNNGPMPQQQQLQQQQQLRRNNIRTFALIKSQVLIKSNNNLPRMTIAADLNNKTATKKRNRKDLTLGLCNSVAADRAWQSRVCLSITHDIALFEPKWANW